MDAVRERLAAAILAAMDRAVANPPVWGVDDCALWCAEPIRIVLGYDPAASFRGRYRTALGANRVLGGTGLAGALADAATVHGWRRIKGDEADTGDIGLAIYENEKKRLVQTCMICRAPGWFVARKAGGFVALDARLIERAWAVV